MPFVTLHTGWGPYAAFQLGLWLYQQSASEILTLSSRYKREKSNLLADEIGLHYLGQVVVWVMHLYLYFYYHSMAVTLLY